MVRFVTVGQDGAVAPEPDPELLHATGNALAAVRRDAHEQALSELTGFIGQAREPASTAAEIVLLLFNICGELIAELGPGVNPAVKLQVFDAEGGELSIDDADPPVRTAVRTLLAQVHGDDDSARDQIDIALGNAGEQELATVLLQALRWTERLATECLEHELAVPDWIAAALTDPR